jgi:hypothetical protein
VRKASRLKLSAQARASLFSGREFAASSAPRQALSAQLIALLLPCWLEGLCDRSCRGEGRT